MIGAGDVFRNDINLWSGGFTMVDLSDGPESPGRQRSSTRPKYRGRREHAGAATLDDRRGLPAEQADAAEHKGNDGV